MLNFIYSWKGYRNLKAGMLCDYYIKRIVIWIIRQLFLVFSWIFSDKFFIEYLSKRVFTFFLSSSATMDYFFFFSYLRTFNLTILYFCLVVFTFLIILI